MVEVRPVDSRRLPNAIERAIDALISRGPNGGLILTTSRHARIHRDQIFASRHRHKIPAIYPNRAYVTSAA